jgi:predicted ATPase
VVRARALSAAITGGPGAGKSSLLHELARRGFETRDEVARDILKSPGGMELREQDPLGFAEAMLEAQIKAWEGAGSSSGPVIFDRGFPDIVGFLRIEGLSVPTAIDLACRNYRVGGPVFLAGPWREIYHSDEQRIQNWEEAVESYRVVSRVWRDYGYDLIDLPKVNLDDRAQFVIDLL